jgi:hypothetical protein
MLAGVLHDMASCIYYLHKEQVNLDLAIFIDCERGRMANGQSFAGIAKFLQDQTVGKPTKHFFF